MRSIQISVLGFIFVLASCDFSQHDPHKHWEQYDKERITANQSQVHLTEEGKLPEPKPVAAVPEPTTAPATEVASSATGAPPDSTPDTAGQKFMTFCISCHGEDGRAATEVGKALKPSPRDFTSKDWQKSVTDEHLAKVIKDGGAANGLSPAMAPWGSLLSDAEVKGIIAKIRAFSK
jgi:mono/diheme cytochrome c family protein